MLEPIRDLRGRLAVCEVGASYHVWNLEEMANLVPEPAPAKRGPYKKKIQTEALSHMWVIA